LKAQIPWLRVFVEGVVIVVSILLAFGIEAWWDGVQEAERRQALLRGLASDFEAAATDLDRVAHMHRRVLDSAERLLLLTNAGEASPSLRATVDSLLTEVIFKATYDPPMGTLDALIGSGELEVLGDADLVGQLTRWPALVEDLTEDEDAGVDHYWSDLGPYLRSRVRVAELVWSDLMEDWMLPWEHGYTDSYELLTDLDFENLVYDRRDIYKTIIDEAHPPLYESITSIRDLVQEQLGN
jgi:hypothetical protein